MTQAYAALTSYQDEGVVLTQNPIEPTPDEIIFTTLFARPNLLRFEWISHHPYPPLRHLKTYAAIWSNGQSSFIYRAPPSGQPATMDELKTLSSAVASATGVSRGSAHDIPRLLLPEVSGFALIDLVAPTVIAIEDFEGVLCYRVAGDHPRGSGRYELWIGKDDFLIRRVVPPAGPIGRATEEIRRNIRINRSIPKQAFEEKPSAPP